MTGTLQLGKAERKYLERYAEPEASAAQRLRSCAPALRYGALLVIPCYGEDALLQRALDSVPAAAAGRPLVVLVINQGPESPGWVVDANRRAFASLSARARRTTSLGAGIDWHECADLDLVAIDRGAPRALPAKQGVGLARKIGADFAFALWAGGGAETPWIHCSDADVRLPRDYFDRVRADSDASALVYDYLHDTEDCPDGGQSILEYEIFLRYYVLGLRSAGSRYAFPTIGSTIAVRAPAYAQVRGFPRRNAAEDFHLLAKLAKLGAVEPMHGAPIVLSGRASERVPFGTGRAVLQARQRTLRGEVFRVYDPRVFAWLGVWLAALDDFQRAPATRLATHATARAGAAGIHASLLCELADADGIEDGLPALAARTSPDRARVLCERFDALATLRFVHRVRDRVHPDLPLRDALAAAPFVDIEASASIAEQRAALAEQCDA